MTTEIANTAFGVFFLAVAAFLTVFLGWAWRTVQAARSWPEAAGRIVRTELRPVHNGIALRVEYRYDVNGKTFRGDRFGPGGLCRLRHAMFPTRGAAERLARERGLRAGARVAVRYDPSSPARAVLDASVQPWKALGYGLALVASLVIGVMLLSGTLSLQVTSGRPDDGPHQPRRRESSADGWPFAVQWCGAHQRRARKIAIA